MRGRRRVEVARQGRQRHRGRGEHEQRRDRTGTVGVEPLHTVLQSAEEKREPEHQDAVGEDRPDERRLDDLDEPLVQGEEGDKELRQVAKAGLHDPGGA